MFLVFGTMAAIVSKLNQTLAWIDRNNAIPVENYMHTTFVGTKKVEASETKCAIVDQLKDELRDKLLGAESNNGHRGDDNVLFTLDFQNKDAHICTKEGGDYPLRCLSFGDYQFKIDTVIGYEKELHNRIITEWEALEITHDNNRAAILFDDIVYRVQGGLPSNWKTSYDKNPVYYDTMVSIIRKCEGIEL